MNPDISIVVTDIEGRFFDGDTGDLTTATWNRIKRSLAWLGEADIEILPPAEPDEFDHIVKRLTLGVEWSEDL